MKKLILAATHAGCLALGFALGIYLLPILTQPESPDIAIIEESLQEASYRRTTFDRNREDSDAFHWGEGELRVYQNTVVFEGVLSPGPDYRLYLTPDYIETESEFLAIKERSQQVGRISTFEGFVLDVPDVGNLAFDHVVIWCETFSQFITSGSLAQDT